MSFYFRISVDSRHYIDRIRRNWLTFSLPEELSILFCYYSFSLISNIFLQAIPPVIISQNAGFCTSFKTISGKKGGMAPYSLVKRTWLMACLRRMDNFTKLKFGFWPIVLALGHFPYTLGHLLWTTTKQSKIG